MRTTPILIQVRSEKKNPDIRSQIEIKQLMFDASSRILCPPESSYGPGSSWGPGSSEDPGFS